MALTVEELRDLLDRVRGAEEPQDARQCVDVLRLAEELKNALTAQQTVAARTLCRIRQTEAAERAHAVGRGVAKDRAKVLAAAGTEIGLARGVSPHRGLQLAHVACTVHEVPRAFGLFRAGRVTEQQVSVLLRETAAVSAEHRRRADTELAQDLPDLSARQTEHRAREIAQRLDPESAVERVSRAAKDRYVHLRPAPDSTVLLSALLPLKDGVAAYAALNRAADTARARGDERTRGQVMADTLVHRVMRPGNASTTGGTSVTGGASATGGTSMAAGALPTDGVDARTAASTWSAGPVVTEDQPAPAAPTPGIEIQLIMTDHALFGESETPARVVGHGTLPARLARQLAAEATEKQLAWFRRLYTDPEDGRLVAMESARRLFPPGMAQFVTTRDQSCRLLKCDAPIRNIDHVVPAAEGGPTTIENAQGLCERCNQVKEQFGWHSCVGPDGRVTVTTPTGHTYTDSAPPLPHEPRTNPSGPTDADAFSHAAAQPPPGDQE